MPFEKGKSGNKNGRDKGVPNKVTQEASSLFIATLEAQGDRIEAALTAVFNEDKAKYLDVMAKYTQYILPKKIDANLNVNKLGLDAIDTYED